MNTVRIFHFVVMITALAVMEVPRANAAAPIATPVPWAPTNAGGTTATPTPACAVTVNYQFDAGFNLAFYWVAINPHGQMIWMGDRLGPNDVLGLAIEKSQAMAWAAKYALDNGCQYIPSLF
jgi:hypothetical protein